MNKIYILFQIYTSENCASLAGTKLSEMYPQTAGTEEAVKRALQGFLNNLTDVKEITSEDVHKGQFFSKVFRGTWKDGHTYFYGISSVYEAS